MTNLTLKQPAIHVFIDASNLWQAQKAKGRMFDYEKLKKVLKDKFAASKIEFFYYTAYPAEGTRDRSMDGKHKFYTYLKKNLGFTVIKKVFIFSSKNNVSQELRTGADKYFDVLLLEEDVWGRALERKQAR